MPSDELISTEELAEILGLKTRTVKSWREKGKGPKFLRLSHKVIRYKKVDVEKWLEQQKR